MKIISWNVNWIRAVLKKGFAEWFLAEKPDILCLQEVKAFENQMPSEMKYFLWEYDYIWHAGERPWYAGTAIFYKKDINKIETKNEFWNFVKFFEDWRMTEFKFEFEGKKFSLLNIYFPNGWTRADGTEMLSYKLKFYEEYLEYIQSLKTDGYEVISTWDFNICHTEIDIARPKENENSIWFLPIERAMLDTVQESWLIDVYRKLNPELKDKYTWWSYRAGARPRNVGRRLDYFWVSEWVFDLVKNCDQLDQVMWSDHCPILLEI